MSSKEATGSITIDLNQPPQPPTRDYPSSDISRIPKALPPVKTSRTHPVKTEEGHNARIYFVGNATTILEWEGLRLMTDPNFLHDGDHVHLGPGVTSRRIKNPSIDLHELPHIDLILLSHYHEDHFDREVEAALRRSIPIVTTPHAHSCLTSKISDPFTAVHPLEVFNSLDLIIKGGLTSEDTMPQRPKMRITAMPGKHVPPGILSTLNDLASAVPPTNGWVLELGYDTLSDASQPSSLSGAGSFISSYKIYISGDTLFIDELREIPKRYPDIDLMLVHLGGTTIPSAKAPLLMVTMDAQQGIQLLQLVNPDVTIPIHFDDYDVMLSSLQDFKDAVTKEGLDNKVVYLDRGDEYKFVVKSAT